MEVEFPIYSFVLEYFDEQAELLRQYVLRWYTQMGEIEIYDVKNRRMFLKKTLTHKLKLEDLIVGNHILVNGRQYKIIDYNDDSTRNEFAVSQQHTYAMLKPGFHQRLGEALDRIYQDGLRVAKLRFGYVSRQTAAKFYEEHVGKPFYETLVGYITSGPIVALELVGDNAIKKWRALIGPTNLDMAKQQAPNSLRALYARSTTENFAHGSDSPASAARELGIIFGEQSVRLACRMQGTTVCVIRPHALKEGNAGKIVQAITAAGYQITGAHLTELDVEAANDAFEVYRGVIDDYMQMIEQMASGPCLALELARDGAADIVAEFRDFIGPRDIAIARKIRPDSVRAVFGRNVVLNAVHCSDLPDEAEIEAQYFFRYFDE